MIGGACAKEGRSPPRLAGVRALIGAQCLGAFNDNVYKTVVSLMAADSDVVGGGGATLLSLSSIAFVAPYILFSGYAGHVADRVDKRSVLVVAKLMEAAAMVLAFVALMAGRLDALIVILLLLSTQATFFSPAKYGILPELLAPCRLSLANGVMEMTRYVAVILGTASGGFVLSLWHGRPERTGALLIGIAGAGLLASLLIGSVPRSGGGRAFRINPWREIAEGMRRVGGDRGLALAVGGITVFEFLCALVMLDMILVAKTQMGLEDLRIGLLGAVVGLGAGIGSVAAGRLSGSRIEPCFAFAGYVGVGAALFALAAAVVSYALTAVTFLALGLFAGMIIVPLNALVQHAAGSDEKGRLIATNNFLNMAGIVAASACLWLLHDIGGVSPILVLILAGLLSLSVAFCAARLAPESTTRALARLLASLRRA